MATRKKKADAPATMRGTYPKDGEIVALRGMTMDIPVSVVDKKGYMESFYRQIEAEERAKAEKADRDQRVLNDRIEQQKSEETMLPSERLQAVESQLAELKVGSNTPTPEEMLSVQSVLVSGQSSLMNAGLQLEAHAKALEANTAEQARLGEETGVKLEEIQKLREELKRITVSHRKMAQLAMEASSQAIEEQQRYNAELLVALEHQREVNKGLREQNDELTDLNEGWRRAFRDEENKNRSAFIRR